MPRRGFTHGPERPIPAEALLAALAARRAGAARGVVSAVARAGERRSHRPDGLGRPDPRRQPRSDQRRRQPAGRVDSRLRRVRRPVRLLRLRHHELAPRSRSVHALARADPIERGHSPARRAQHRCAHRVGVRRDLELPRRPCGWHPARGRLLAGDGDPPHLHQDEPHAGTDGRTVRGRRHHGTPPARARDLPGRAEGHGGRLRRRHQRRTGPRLLRQRELRHGRLPHQLRHVHRARLQWHRLDAHAVGRRVERRHREWRGGSDGSDPTSVQRAVHSTGATGRRRPHRRHRRRRRAQRR